MASGLENTIDCAYAHLLKSEGERQIAALLDQCGIRYMYEAPVIVNQHGKSRIWYPDFHLPEFGLYIEYYGLIGNPDYDRGVIEKNTAYTASGISVISVYPNHLKRDWPGYLVREVHSITQHRAQLAEARLRSWTSPYATCYSQS